MSDSTPHDLARRALEDAAPPFVLAIDVGSSSVRAGLYDRSGRAIAGSESIQRHELRTTLEGTAEANPDALLNVVWQCVDTVLATVGTAGDQIAGIATATLASNVLGIDDAGTAVTPLITYADTRAATDAAQLGRELNEPAIHDRTGCHLHSSYLPARFRWFARTRPAQFERVTRWVSLGEYMHLQLFGATAVSYSIASWTGLLNRRRLEWDRELVEALPITIDDLSSLTDVDSSRRGLREPFASRWPALADVPWFPAVGDGAAANVGSGCLSPRHVALTIGTTSAMRAITEQPPARIPDALWCYRVDGRRSLLGGALSEGGHVYEWMVETLQLDSDDLQRTLSEMEPAAHGLTVLPFLAGERSPTWNDNARATIHGLSVATTPLEIVRAGLEAVAYRLALVYEEIAAALPEPPDIVASGGALHNSPVWCQIIADVLGQPVTLSNVEEASSRGAALLALEALGVIDTGAEVPALQGKTYEPTAAHYDTYRDALTRQEELYARLYD